MPVRLWSQRLMLQHHFTASHLPELRGVISIKILVETHFPEKNETKRFASLDEWKLLKSKLEAKRKALNVTVMTHHMPSPTRPVFTTGRTKPAKSWHSSACLSYSRKILPKFANLRIFFFFFLLSMSLISEMLSIGLYFSC